MGVGCHFLNWIWQYQQLNACVRIHGWAWKEGQAVMCFSRTTFRFCEFLLWAQEAPRREKSRLRSRNTDDLSILMLLFNNMMKVEKKKQVRGKAETSLLWETVTDFYESCFYKMWKHFISWTARFPHLHYPWISAQASFSLQVLLMRLLLSKKAQLLSFQMKKGTFPWSKICPLARLLKSHQVKTYPLPILTITVARNGL